MDQSSTNEDNKGEIAPSIYFDQFGDLININGTGEGNTRILIKVFLKV